MIYWLALIGIPIAYLVVLVNLLARKDRKGLGISVFLAALAAGTAYWSITQSRSSAAGIGIIGLPFIGALGGFLGLAFGRWRASTHGGRSVGALLSLGGAVLLIAFSLREGWKAIGKNQVRDEKQAAHAAEIERDRALIAAGLAENENRQRAYLDSSIRARMTDRAFLIAALENDSVSPEIIRELYTRPGTITGLDIWFARNPATPRDILDRIARTTKEPGVINALQQRTNPAKTSAPR